MEAQAKDPPADGAAESTDKRTPAAGVSQFLARIFEQLSLSSWLPAAMLVGNLAVLLQMRSQQSTGVIAAVKGLSEPLGVVVALLFALVLATIVLQAFEFELIRALEGYFDSMRGPVAGLAGRRIRVHEQRQQDVKKAYREARNAAFGRARTKLLQLPNGPYTQAQLDLLERVVLQLPSDEPLERDQVRAVMRIPWRDQLPAAELYRLDVLNSRVGWYPQRHRVLPTKLGNVLRAAEDQLQLQPGENLEGYVLRHYDKVPALVRNDHHDYRTRLQMYTSLLLVFLLLGGAAIGLRAGWTPWWAPLATAATFLGLGVVAYQASLAAARGYGLVLLEMDRWVRRAENS